MLELTVSCDGLSVNDDFLTKAQLLAIDEKKARELQGNAHCIDAIQTEFKRNFSKRLNKKLAKVRNAAHKSKNLLLRKQKSPRMDAV